MKSLWILDIRRAIIIFVFHLQLLKCNTKKINIGETVFEFHNNWLGEETVIVDGQIVSKK